MDISDDWFGIENSTDATDWTQQAVFPEYQAERVIVRIFTPCILAIGTFGNIATFCVMRRMKDHNSSQHAILMTLAVSDFVLIQTALWRRLLHYFVHIDLRLWHTLVCKLYFWLLHVSGILSSWLVTSVTVQRAMSVTWPHKMKALCTTRRTWMVIASLVLVTCSINVHFWVGIQITSGGNSCQPGTAEYRRFFSVWTWVFMLLFSFLPSLIQIVCDVILCVALFKSVSAMPVTIGTTSAGGGGGGGGVGGGGGGGGDVDADHHDLGKGRRKTASRITLLCLALSSAFLILTLPICFEEIWFNSVSLTFNTRSHAEWILRDAIFNLMGFLNSAINFFLYCIAGTKFRKEFVNWICCRSQRSSTASVSNAATGGVKGKN